MNEPEWDEKLEIAIKQALKDHPKANTKTVEKLVPQLKKYSEATSEREVKRFRTMMTTKKAGNL